MIWRLILDSKHAPTEHNFNNWIDKHDQNKETITTLL